MKSGSFLSMPIHSLMGLIFAKISLSATFGQIRENKPAQKI